MAYDDASLAASPGLWSSITEAMDESRFFVLLASPGAAASPWVAKEIEYWRSTEPPGTLLPGGHRRRGEPGPAHMIVVCGT